MGKGGVAAAPEKRKDESYTFAAQPQPVGSRKKPKFRPAEEEYGPATTNIMFDKRVIRGNTYAAQILPAALPQEESKTVRKTTGPRYKPPSTPEPVEGRRHVDIQTDTYLEELTDTVPEADVTTQTDAFMDRPPTPLFIPMKIGVDVETQILPGDLFDFDFEVEPILEVLVGKTLEQGLMEVMEEEELAAMRAHQEHFEQIRNAELVATQRMEASEKRKIEEKERRLAQERERLEREKVVREKVAAQTFARGYLSGLVGNVFDKLYEAGFFYDPVQKEVETEFMPWLTDEVVKDCSKAAVARKCVDDIIVTAIKANITAKKATEAKVLKEVEDEKAALKAEEEAKAAALVAAAEAKKVMAGKILHELEVITEEQLAETKQKIMDARAAELPPPPEVEEGEEAPPPPEIPEPTNEELLEKLLDDGVITEEQITEALANKE